MNPSIPAKFGLALMILGSGYLFPVLGVKLASPSERVALVWFVALFFSMVCGELCLAPVSMNMITRLCPKRVVGMMMGSMFLALSAGSFLAGRLANLVAVETVDGQVVDSVLGDRQ